MTLKELLYSVDPKTEVAIYKSSAEKLPFAASAAEKLQYIAVDQYATS